MQRTVSWHESGPLDGSSIRRQGQRGFFQQSSARFRREVDHSSVPSVFVSTIGYYAEVSSQIRGIFERFTPLLEPPVARRSHDRRRGRASLSSESSAPQWRLNSSALSGHFELRWRKTQKSEVVRREAVTRVGRSLT